MSLYIYGSETRIIRMGWLWFLVILQRGKWKSQASGSEAVELYNSGGYTNTEQ